MSQPGVKVKNDYVAIIAEDYEVENSEELRKMLKRGKRPKDSAMFRFTLESDTPELVILVAWGYFFSRKWSQYGSVSWVGLESEVRNA